MGDKCTAKLNLMCKTNGLNHACFCEEKVETRKRCKSQFLDTILRLNGSVKSNNNNSFPRPSIPVLRSRKERHSSGSEFSKRRRRSSRHDPGDSTEGEPPDGTYEAVPTTAEVATITRNCQTTTSAIICSSVPHTKEIKDLLPLVSGSGSNGIVPFTPDTSGSCTPVSCGTAPSPGGKDTPCKDIPTECQWKDCDKTLENQEIMDHIRTCHVLPQSKNETFVCLWIGCKVYDKKSCSKSWLDRHILSHSGDKPFRCIVAGCGARFTSQNMLERHVNSHFTAQEQQTPNQKSLKGREDTPTKLLKRKRLKKRKANRVKTEDYFDTGIMESIQEQLNAITSRTEIDINGSLSTITFHSTVIARRTEESGKTRVLLHWTPEDILQDEWVLESQVTSLQTLSIPVHQLPRESVTSLHPSLYNQHRYRKHRRK